SGWDLRTANVVTPNWLGVKKKTQPSALPAPGDAIRGGEFIQVPSQGRPVALSARAQSKTAHKAINCRRPSQHLFDISRGRLLLAEAIFQTISCNLELLHEAIYVTLRRRVVE